MTKPRNVFVEFHALTSHVPSNLNRDDLGTPKSAIFGGHRRLRISSQCLKRTWRTSDFFRGELADELLGVRTSQLPAKLRAELSGDTDPLPKEALDGLVGLLLSLGKSSKTVRDEEDEEDEAIVDGDAAAGPPDATVDASTAHLLFLSHQEIEAIKGFARLKSDALAKAFAPKKGKGKKGPEGEEKAKGGGIDSLRKALQQHLAEHCQRNAVDVALFGRFVTSPEISTVDAALQVAHAIGTQKAEVEYDYFSAVDDLTSGSGAGHIGETEFASSVFYKYAVCDTGLLTRNLAGDAALSARAMRAIALAMARAVPRGKINGTAPHNPAEYVEVVVRRDAPVSLANAFLQPVRPGGDLDVMDVSIERLRKHRDRYTTIYGEDVIGRFVIDARGEVSLSLKELAEQVEAALLAELAPEGSGALAEAS